MAELPWHSKTLVETQGALATGAGGLSTAEAQRRLTDHGRNVLPAGHAAGPLEIVWRQLNNPISWVLVVAAALAIAVGKVSDALVVLGAVVVNAAIGFVQEWRATRAIAALAGLVAHNAVAVRDGHPVTVPAEELVPGDVVQLQAGDRIPADLRLISLKGLAVDESTLTGESVPATKHVEPVAAQAVPGDRTCMAFGGTLVTRGVGTGIVVATGPRTELGHVDALLRKTPTLETPITRQLARFSAWIAGAVVVLALLLLAYGVLVRGAPLGDAVLTAITLAVAAIPEGLPAIVTIALAIGVSRMAARRAVIRQLPAVETLGSTSVICSDKTGTLTRNEMTVQALWTSGREYRLTGVGYAPVGRLERDGELLAAAPPEVDALLRCAVLCNDAALSEGNGTWTIAGDPTEAALVVAGRKVGLGELALRAETTRLDVIPFDSQAKFMATLDDGPRGRTVHLKGGVEQVLDRCGLAPEEAGRVRHAMEAFAEQGLRVLAFARKDVDLGSIAAEDVADGFELLGLAGMIDPPRTEAIEAVARCKAAGVVVKMITGDHPATAISIGRVLGLVAPGDRAVTGAELEALDDAQLREVARAHHVFARVSPAHKLRLVDALQAQGHVVAMTGDGVNDAPALKRADVGVAMGITGTAVAQQAAKVVLTDDNFASIAAAIEEGRRVYDNLVKALAFLLPTNLGVALILVAATLFFPVVPVRDGAETLSLLLVPMSATQILWINLVASVALSVPLAFEVLEPDGMRRAPRARDESILSRFVLVRTVVVAVLMAGGACLLFLWEYFRILGAAAGPPDLPRHVLALAEAQTLCVTTVTTFQICYLFNCRSLLRSVFAIGFFKNPAVFVGVGVLLLLQCAFMYVPAMQQAFGTAPLDVWAWTDALLVGCIVFPAVLIEKRLRRAASGPR